jgi:hypothetical protein
MCNTVLCLPNILVFYFCMYVLTEQASRAVICKANVDVTLLCWTLLHIIVTTGVTLISH